MILRSLKLTNFRGVESLVARDFPREGVARVALPPGSDPSVLADAVRFVFTGETPAAGVFSEGAGFAFVEVGFRLGGDERVSLFRGLDSRGNLQVSLREEGGRRVTGGDDSVRSRLAELLGGEPNERLSGAWLTPSDLEVGAIASRAPRPDDTAEFNQPVKLVPLPDFTQETGIAVAGPLLELRSNALAAAGDLRSALRAERLGRLAAERHTELLAAGARLRRQRVIAAQAADELAAERDRARARLNGVREYRDQVSVATARDADRERAVAPPPRVSFAAPWTLATLASALFLVLVLISTGRDGPPASDSVQTGVGIAFLVAVALSVSVTARRLTQEADTGERTAPGGGAREAAADPSTLRASVQQRFHDLGDPDDPELLPRLDARARELEQQLAPLHAKLESIDDALTAFDVEAGRTARALHLPMPDRVTAETGLSDEETVERVRASVRDLGDAAYQATVEREALLAGGAPALPAAAEAAAAALKELGAVTESPAEAKHAGLERWRDPGRDGESTRLVTASAEDASEDAEIASLEETIERLAVTAAARAAGVAVPELPTDAGTGRAATSAVPDTSDTVSTATDGAFDAVYRGADGGLRARASHGRGGKDWDDLEPQIRVRIAVALAVTARPAPAEGAPGVVVLPSSLADVGDDALLAAVSAGRAGIVQVIAPEHGSEPTPPTSDELATDTAAPEAEAPTDESGGSTASRPARKSTARTKRKRKGGGKTRRKKKN